MSRIFSLSVLIFLFPIWGCTSKKAQLEACLDQLKDSNETRRARAAEELRHLCLSYKDRDVREAAVCALSRSLTDSSHLVRAVAANCLSNIPYSNPTAILALSRALKDSSPTVRTNACAALYSSGDSALPAIESLLDALDDPEPTVQFHAMCPSGKRA